VVRWIGMGALAIRRQMRNFTDMSASHHPFPKCRQSLIPKISSNPLKTRRIFLPALCRSIPPIQLSCLRSRNCFQARSRTAAKVLFGRKEIKRKISYPKRVCFRCQLVCFQQNAPKIPAKNGAKLYRRCPSPFGKCPRIPSARNAGGA